MPWKSKEKRRAWNILNRDRINKTRNKRYRQWLETHPEVYAANMLRQKVRVERDKIKVLTYYGGGSCGCVKCGESRLACLTIDHMNGRETTEHEDKKLHGKALYNWLRKNDYPQGYQTLCMNCQWVKRCENGETGGGAHS